MFKIEKVVKVEIDGPDFDTLSDVCEAARVYLHDRRNAHYPGQCGQFDPEQVRRMESFLLRIFDI